MRRSLRVVDTKLVYISYAVRAGKSLTGVVVCFSCAAIKPASKAKRLEVFGASGAKVDHEVVQGETIGKDEFVLAVQSVDSLLVDLLAHSKERRDKRGWFFVLASDAIVHEK